MSTQANQPLPDGTQLENYHVLRVLAHGGFSFVYLAHDENETPVAIKEYLPSTLAVRTNGAISPNVPDEDSATFKYGMKCFFEEGRALASLSHPCCADRTCGGCSKVVWHCSSAMATVLFSEA